MCITHGRSGTEFVFSGLKKYIYCGDEILNEVVLPRVDSVTDLIDGYHVLGNLPKIQLYQLYLHDVSLNNLRQIVSRYPILFITRRNLFEKTLSAYVGCQVKKFHTKKGEEFTYPEMEVDTRVFKEWYDLCIRLDSELRLLIQEISFDHLELYYEDFQDNLEEACNAIMRFAGYTLPINGFQTNLVKRTQNFSSFIKNYDELCSICKLQ